MKIIKDLEYKEKQISFSLYDKTWRDTEKYISKNLEDMEKLKKEIAKNIILLQYEIKVNSTNGIELMYAFLKTAKEVREFLSTFDKATEEPVRCLTKLEILDFIYVATMERKPKKKQNSFWKK